MVPVGGAKRTGRDDAANGRLGLALVVLILVVSAFAITQFAVNDFELRAQAEISEDDRGQVGGKRQPNGTGDHPKKIQRSDAAAIFSADMALFQAIFALGGLAAALGAVVYAQRAWQEAAKATKLTAQLFVDEKRPWISVEVEKAKIIFGEGDQLYVEMHFVIRNVGAHPATGITLVGEQFRTFEHGKWLSTPDMMIREARAMGVPFGIGHTLFPGESMPHGQVFPAEVRRRINDVTVGGYVQYNFSMSDQAHFTPWAYELYFHDGMADETVEATFEKYFTTAIPT